MRRSLRAPLARLLLGFVPMLWCAQALAHAPIDDVLAAQKQRVERVAQLTPAVVAVLSVDGEGGGSGVLIDRSGLALTNYHVVQPCGYWMKCGLADGRLYDAVLVGIDPVGDVAMIQLLGRDDFPVCKWGNSDDVRPGDEVYVAGNPFLLANDFRPTITYGIVSGAHRWQEPAGTLLEYADCIQVDASINPGNSGGPLLNANSELIGVNGRASFEKRGRVNVGVGYAISVNQIRMYLASLKSGRLIDHASFGALLASDADGRAVVSTIDETSDPYRRGLQAGDVVIEIAGKRVRNVNVFKNILGTLPAHWRVPLTYSRDGQTQQILVRLDSLHRPGELVDLVSPPKQGEKEPRRPMNPPSPDEPQPSESKRQTPSEPKGVVAPANVKALIQERRGFANYHFNKLAQERVWNRHVKFSGGGLPNGEWRLETKTNTDTLVNLRLGDETSTLEAPAGDFEFRVAVDGVNNLDPPESGGLLATLHFWRKLAKHGPTAFDQLQYQGEFPLDAQGTMADVLFTDEFGVGVRWYFRVDDGQLALVELQGLPSTDPCELWIEDYQDRGSGLSPSRLIARVGDEEFASFMVTSFSIDPAPPKATADTGAQALGEPRP